MNPRPPNKGAPELTASVFGGSGLRRSKLRACDKGGVSLSGSSLGGTKLGASADGRSVVLTTSLSASICGLPAVLATGSEPPGKGASVLEAPVLGPHISEASGWTASLV